MFAAVGFDLGDTLVEYVGVPLSWQAEYPAGIAAFSASLGVELEQQQLVAALEALTSFNTRIVPRLAEVDDATVFGGLMEAAGVAMPRERGAFDDAVDAFFSVFRGRARALEGGSELVAELLERRVGVGVLTDVPYGMPRRLVLDDLRLAQVERLADTTITSVEAGWRKPSAQGFALLARRLEVSPAEMLYVGNERKDIEGARATGMRAALLWSSDEAVPDWGQSHTVSRLADVLALD